MIERIIDFSARNRFLVLVGLAVLLAAGVWAVATTPLDAIPDLSEHQVIIFTEWMGRSPTVVEDQVTFPLVTALQGIPQVDAIRAQSMFGMSFVYIIFDESTDLYWARSRVLERLATVRTSLPEGVQPQLGPDGTGVGHVFWYTLEGPLDLGTLRAVQDWYVRLHLQAVPGVAEVASVGGFVRQYQIDVDPIRMKAYGVTLAEIQRAVQRSNNEVGGKLIELSDAEYLVRGQGYIDSQEAVEAIVVASRGDGAPIYVRDIATVQFGGDIRRGALEKDGKGQVVGGIVVMRSGENALEVIDRVKQRLAEISPGLPDGVSVLPAYDRSSLIEAAVETLRRALLEEALIVSIMVFLFLLHIRSVIRVIIEIPIAVLSAFLLMRVFGITSNIMSLGGIALAIGVIVDASIVLVENAHRNVARAQEGGRELSSREYIELSIRSARQVGRPIFYSVAIMVVSFLPVFLLEGQEGRLFRPLAFTKTFVLASSAIIAITVVPVLMTVLTRGRFRNEQQNPVTRLLNRLYAPLIRGVLRRKKATIAISVATLIATVPLALSLGSEFMPSLDEGSLLFMPVTLPSASITEVNRIMQVQDAVIMSVPEVASVLGKVGRAETATDPAPVSMIESIIKLKPRNQWRPGVSRDDIIAELDAKLQIPGVRNGWTQPIINRINMLATGVRTDLGVKIFGPDLATLERLAVEAESVLRTVPGAADVYAERVQGGFYLDIDIDREGVARYGVMLGDVQDVIESAVGGENIGTVVDGRQRFPIRVRYERVWRSSPDAIRSLLVPVRSMPPRVVAAHARPASSGPTTGDAGRASSTYVPLGQLASISIVPGPSMIASENATPRAIVYLNVRGRDMGSFVGEARQVLEQHLRLPEGYTVQWSGQWESQIRARERLLMVVPLVLLIIFVMLYMVTKDVAEASVVMLSVPFALLGGIYLVALLGFNMSVAVWVGFIALYGLAVETGVVMVVYLHEALDRRIRAAGTTTALRPTDIRDAAIEGSVLRLRPKIMTVGTSLIALVPIMWSSGVGADVMKPLVAPLIGGLITSALHVLVVTPVLFSLMKERALRRGTLSVSRMSSWMLPEEAKIGPGRVTGDISRDQGG